MKIEQIIALSQAGFTKDDILAMYGQSQQMQMQMQTSPQQMQTPQQMQMQTPQQMQMQTPPPIPPLQQMSNGFYSYAGNPQTQQNDVLDALKNLTRSVQSNNVNMMQNQVPKQVTTEDAIASIINPPNYDGLTDGGDK